MSHHVPRTSLSRRIAALFLLAATSLFSSASAETLTVEFLCPYAADNSDTQTKYFNAVWLTSGTTYKGTLGHYGSVSNSHYNQMKKHDPEVGSTAKKPDNSDAKMGATPSFTSAEKNAGGKAYTFANLNVTSLPDGAYTIHFETVRWDNNYSYGTATWTKTSSSTPRTLLSITTPNTNDAAHPFKDVYLTYTAAASTASTMSINAGNGQTGTVATALATAPSVVIKDASNNPVAGVTVTFTVTGGGGSVSATTANTNASGFASVTWTLGTTAGTNNNTMTASANATGSPLTFTASATAGAANKIAVNAGNGQSAKVNTNVGTAPSVIVRDVHNNVKAGVSVNFAVASGGGTISGTNPVTTNASGIATIGSWKLGTTAGSNTLTASAAGLSGSPLTFTATGTVSATDASKISSYQGNGQTATVGTAVPIKPGVLVQDAFNNPISGVSVTFAVTGGGGTVTGATATSNASGIASVTDWTLGTAPGANTLTATKTGLTGSPVTFTATGSVGTTNSITISAGNNQTATVKSNVAIKPAVLVKDSSGNPIPNQAVTFSVASGGGSVTGGSTTTNSSGIATVTNWTMGTKAGSNTLAASANGKSVTFTATATAGPAASVTINAGGSQTSGINTAVPVKPSVLVTDSDNNPVSGVSVVFTITDGGGSVSGANQTTNASGVATVGSWTLGSAAGPNELTATVSGLTPVVFSATANDSPAPPSDDGGSSSGSSNSCGSGSALSAFFLVLSLGLTLMRTTRRSGYDD